MEDDYLYERDLSERLRQKNNLAYDILSEEKHWQNLLKQLTVSQKKNRVLRKYLLKLSTYDRARSLIKTVIDKHSPSEYQKEIVQQLIQNNSKKDHLNNLYPSYYWSRKRISEESNLFSKANRFNENLLDRLVNRSDGIKRHIGNIDNDNQFLISIVRDLKKNKNI